MDNNVAEFNRWFSQAEQDLKAAKVSVKSGYFEWACFQSQQAAEKALKAFLMRKGKRELLTHSVYELLKDCAALDKRFNLLIECKLLDQYYVPTRYPGGLPAGTPHDFYKLEDAEKCVSCAGRILAAIREFAK